MRFHLLTKPVLFQDDYRVCLASGIVKKGGKLPCPVDASGKFTSEVSDFQGQHVKVQIQYTEMDDKFWQSACSCTLPWVYLQGLLKRNIVCRSGLDMFWFQFFQLSFSCNHILNIRQRKIKTSLKIVNPRRNLVMKCHQKISVMSILSKDVSFCSEKCFITKS